jgi:hypothetical protein
MSETQNALLMSSLLAFYEKPGYLEKMMHIINGESRISLRIIDWFVTNYAKKYYTAYEVPAPGAPAKKVVETDAPRVRVYKDYKLKLKAYNKRRFDPFCRWERIVIPYDKAADTYMETTLGQLNFFKWAIEMCIIEYIDANYVSIERDMNERNTASRKRSGGSGKGVEGNRTRKSRAEPAGAAGAPVSSCGV